MNGQLAGSAGAAVLTVVLTVVVVFVALVGIGFWILARRRKGGSPDALTALQQRANILLVRVDDAVRNADDELAFAIAQFGDVRSREFEAVLTAAKAQLREAFGLQQKLDDAYPDTETQRRDWSGRIIHLCEAAQSSLEAQEKAFADLRELEKNAPQNLAAARSAIAAVDARVNAAWETMTALRNDYAAPAIASVADNLDRAAQERKQAASDVDRAAALLDAAAPGAPGAPDARSATDLIRTASEHAYRAQKLLDAIDALRDELGKAAEAVASLRDSTRTSLTEARAARDAPPDPAVGASLGHAIDSVEKVLAAQEKLADPLASLEALRTANAELDTSMAGARNQRQRLEGARTALVGALVGARSQLAATRNFIDTRRGGVGSEARTRLAEAERLLAVAETEKDPVAALDTARSSATYSRDADALARFDLMGR
jgi:DNA repair exonuclease SbcCD ATPase subunit